METIILWVANAIAAYGFNKGLDKIFESKESFSKQLHKIIDETIIAYSKKYHQIDDTDGKFAFYKSQIIIEEFLKFRLFAKTGYTINENRIQTALEKNPNILKPSAEQLEEFFKIFDEKVNNNEQLKKLEIAEFHKEKIFEIYEKVEKILSFLQINLVEVVGLLEEEYRQEINDCFEEIKTLKPETALNRIVSLESRIDENAKHITETLRANLLFIKGICYESIGKSNESFECFIKAYKLSPKNSKYLDRACISYYLLKDKTYKKLKTIIEAHNNYNVICWAIDTIEASNILTFLNDTVPSIVKEKHWFKRLVLNNLIGDPKVDNLLLLAGLEFNKLSKQLPEIIDYDNLHHWVFMFNSVFINYSNNSDIPFWGHLRKDEDSLFLLQLGRILSKAVIKSELDKGYYNIVFHTYWFESEIDIAPDTIHLLKEAYKNLKEKDTFLTLLLANSIQKHVSKDEAIKLIDSYEGEIDEDLLALKTFCSHDKPDSTGLYQDYFDKLNVINELNIQNVCSLVLSVSSQKKMTKDNLLESIEHIEFSNKSFEKLIRIVIESYYKDKEEVSLSDIDQLKGDLKNEKRLFFYIALIYFENDYFLECVTFIKSYLDETKESRDLFLYVKALNHHKKSDQIELLRLLKLWREKYSFNDYLLRIELEIRQILKDWEEILSICEYGLTKLPSDEGFFTLYLIALAVLKRKEKIENEVTKAVGFKFIYTENALRVANILIDYGYQSEGLELVYQKAINKSDSTARINYFMLSSDLSQDLFMDFQEVNENTYVKFNIEGEQKTVLVNQDSLTDPIVEPSLGKKVLDTYSVKSPVSSKIRVVKVLRIMNKYLALVDEILDEANSSFSGLPVESIQFNGTDKESIEKTLIENFGESQIQRQKETENNFNAYYLYNLSFTELASSNFDGEYIDAYYYLTSYHSNGFYTLPLKYINKNLPIDCDNVVIDFTSGLLFFELSKKFDLKFENLIIAQSLLGLIENTIRKASFQERSTMSVTILENKIIPHFYGKEFHECRISFLIDIRKWFLKNAKAVVPDEKIDIIRPLYEEGKITASFECFIDNCFLAQRKNHVIISDDFGYGKLMNIAQKVLSTEFYLTKKFPYKKTEILEYLLTHRYVGISIDKEVLYSAYLNRHKIGNDHVYTYALRNISLKQNFNPFNIFMVVDFLREIALKSLIPAEKYQIDATNIFVFLMSSFPKPSFYVALKQRIEQKFYLLGNYSDFTKQSLMDALKIMNRK